MSHGNRTRTISEPQSDGLSIYPSDTTEAGEFESPLHLSRPSLSGRVR